MRGAKAAVAAAAVCTCISTAETVIVIVFANIPPQTGHKPRYETTTTTTITTTTTSMPDKSLQQTDECNIYQRKLQLKSLSKIHILTYDFSPGYDILNILLPHISGDSSRYRLGLVVYRDTKARSFTEK